MQVIVWFLHENLPNLKGCFKKCTYFIEKRNKRIHPQRNGFVDTKIISHQKGNFLSKVYRELFRIERAQRIHVLLLPPICLLCTNVVYYRSGLGLIQLLRRQIFEHLDHLLPAAKLKKGPYRHHSALSRNQTNIKKT